jgi:nitrate/nitrite transporter NarK
MVTMAGTGINLALGILYTWSIFKGAIKKSIETGGPGAFAWDLGALNDPYAVCCLLFAFSMILAGKTQDRFGPRVTAIIGGMLVGLGFIWISQTTTYLGWIFGFGILAGTGIAFGYSSATPPALKWYPPMKTGAIAGIVVSGFGLASVYIAPLAKYLLGSWGLQNAMLFFGIAFLIAVSLLGMLLVNPPKDYVPPGFIDRRSSSPENETARASFVQVDSSPGEMMKTRNFWLLWLIYGIGAGAGLMVIGSVAGMAKKSLGDAAFLAVALLGVLSDKIGRRQTLAIVFAFQALLMFGAIPITSREGIGPVILVVLSVLIGFNYGANLALFPSFTKDLWGVRNFGVNYGVVFTAWGIGGFVMSRLSQSLLAATGTFSTSFFAAGVLLLIGMAMTALVRDRKWISATKT